MEGLFLELTPGPALLAGAILLVMVAVVALTYLWLQEKRAHRAAEREPLKKAA